MPAGVPRPGAAAAAPDGDETRRVRAFGSGLAGIGLLVAPVFLVPAPPELLRFAQVTLPALAVLVVASLLGLVAVRAWRALPAVVASGLCAAAAALQLVQTGRATNVVGGNASTFSLLLGIALGWAVVALVLRPAQRAPAATQGGGPASPGAR